MAEDKFVLVGFGRNRQAGQRRSLSERTFHALEV
jgi:hypothetical protein